MYRFSKRVTNLPNSGIGYMMRYAAKYPDAVSLGQGTPLFPTPAFIYEALMNEARNNPLVGMYSDTKAEIEDKLKSCIAQEMAHDYGFTPDLNRMVITVGGVGALFAAILSLVEKGDEVIYFDPGYALHLSQLHLAEATPVYVPYDEEGGWSMNSTALKKAITKRTKMIILTNPNNPTGSVLSESQVRDLADLVLEHDIMLLLDEAYFFLTYDKKLFSPMRIPEVRDHIVLCRSFSKEFAMTGWRIGYAYAVPEIAEKMGSVQIYFSVCPPTPSIVAATIALSDPRGKETTAWLKGKFTESKTAICERLDKLPKLFSYHKPDGAYYIFAKYHGFEMPAMDFTKLVVDEAKVVMIPGSGMGPSGAGHVRMSFAADASIVHAAFDRLDAFAKVHNLL